MGKTDCQGISDPSNLKEPEPKFRGRQRAPAEVLTGRKPEPLEQGRIPRV